MRNFMKGLAFGSAIGGAIAFVTAPNTGSKTREKIEAKVNETTERFTSLKNDVTTVQNDFAQTKENLATTQACAEELIPAFTKGLQKDMNAFQFQMAPRLARIQEQIAKLQADLPQEK